MSIEITINCNGCGEVMGAGKTASQARAGLRHVHGIRLALPGGRDYCPGCVTEPADGEQPPTPATEETDR